ncbi:MAG TPA: DUF3667 domain-containing protein [Steroidobacteraceae bacterium]|nr:DUF3667 domain-containing protein [Steroidobacteraceae bacterium]
MQAATCANCDAPLTGPYCAQCGQHAHESARSVGTLLHDGWHVLTHLDGRLWRTLAALLLHPGRLTHEYFAERRARYLPPVRLYLVVSVLFFALATIGPHRDARTAVDALAKDPTASADIAEARHELQQALKRPDGAAGPIPGAAKGFIIGVDTQDCEKLDSSINWLKEPLRRACRRNVGDSGRAAMRVFVASIPKVMFLFLPLMALLMLLLYWRPRRYYVEHLVFFLHTHAALFLVLLAQLTLSGLTAWLPALARVGGIARFAGFVYAVWYVYRAMRDYYGQRRWLTLAKLTAVGLAYMVFLSITLLATLVASALTV